MGKPMSGDDLAKTTHFISQHAFEPCTPEEVEALMQKYGGDASKVVGDDEEARKARNILKGVSILSIMRNEEMVHIDDFVADPLEGYQLRLKRGSLGLNKV